MLNEFKGGNVNAWTILIQGTGNASFPLIIFFPRFFLFSFNSEFIKKKIFKKKSKMASFQAYLMAALTEL